MSKVVIEIAGTTVGGSSYTRRVMKAVTEAEAGNRPVEVHIGKGAEQVSVYKSVSAQVLELYTFVSRFGGSPKFAVKVVML